MQLITRSDGLIVPKLEVDLAKFRHCAEGMVAVEKDYFLSDFMPVLKLHDWLYAWGATSLDGVPWPDFETQMEAMREGK